MNNKQKNSKIVFLLFIFFVSAFHYDLKAQTISTYYGFSSDVMNPNGLKVDSSGNFYFINYDRNWNSRISKLSSTGIISTVISGNYSPQNVAIDNAGNLFFSDGNTWPPEIKKVTPDGTVSVFASGDFYAQDITFNDLGEMYFSDGYNWPGSIKKVTTDGTVSSFVADPDSYPQYLVSDKSGNLYFTDNYNWPAEIKKVTPDGTVSSFASGDFYPQNLCIDSSGNLYFIDQNNWPNDIKKITPDGTVSVFLSSVSSNNPNSLTIDKSGNLYFIDQVNGQYLIQTIRNPIASCNTPQPPIASDTAVCYGNSINLYAGGIGEVQWYDSPVDGVLLNTGNNFMTPALTSDITYYAQANFCNSTSTRTAVNVIINSAPNAVISGSTTGNDYVTLTASGGSSYLWSGGYSNTSATNVFTKSGTYSVTVTLGVCSSVASATVTISKFGLNKNGGLIKDTLAQLSKNGAVNAETFVNKQGESKSSIIGDGTLNYAVFTTGSACASNAGDLTILTNPANQTSTGVYAATTLLDWSSWSKLNNAGISIPNGGETFALVASGYFVPEESGNYTFTCEGDDAVDLFINGINVANNYSCHPIGGLGSHKGTIYLTTGTRYSFRARMQENNGGEGLRVFWRKPSENSGWYIHETEIISK